MVALLALAAPALGRRLASPQNDVPNDYDGFIWTHPGGFTWTHPAIG